MTDRWRALLQDVVAGSASIDEALARLRAMPLEVVTEDGRDVATLDHHRALRTGAPEVVYGEGKTPAEVGVVAKALLARSGSLLVTRASPEHFAAVRVVADDAAYHARARLITVARARPAPIGTCAVVCAGTSDLAVADEAALTAEHFGVVVERVVDVGVAGLHRVLAARERIEAQDVVIVVAGMEGALASVVGGLVSKPIVAVPTSVGYGAAFGGVAALLAMLNACASGVTVVNIDNGFGAAMAARRMLAARPRPTEGT